jgi:N-methylhydantoinase B
LNDALVEVIMRTLSHAIPEDVLAGCGRISANNVVGFNPRINAQFAGLDFTDIETGAGATEGFDGWPTLGVQGGQGWAQLPDMEIMQLVWPIRILQNEQIKDELTPGKFCGGPAKAYRFQFLTDLSCLLWGTGYQEYSAPRGLFGGYDAKPNRDTIIRTDGTVENIEANTFYQVKTGDIKDKYVQGGGGYGDPLEREPWRVRDDVYNELVSLEKASEIYGVVINPKTIEVDEEATKELRAKKKK